MKIKYSALVSGARNKLNGSVASRNRYGDYFRNKTTPINPRTAYQTAVRAVFAMFSSAWLSLTQAQVAAWNAASANFPFTDIFGDTLFLSGNSLFVKLNTNIKNAGGTQIDDPPEKVAVPGITSVTLTASNVSGTVTISAAFTTSSTPGANNTIIAYATPGVSSGKTYVKNLYRLMAGNISTTSPAVLSTDYTARFGDPVVGSKVFVRLAVLDKTTGQMGVPFETSAIVASS